MFIFYCYYYFFLFAVKLIFFIIVVIVSLCLAYCLGKKVKWAHERHVYQNPPGQRNNTLVMRVYRFLCFIFENLHPRRLLTFASEIFGNNLDPRNCIVEWRWVNPEVVGQTMTFFIKVDVNVFLMYYTLFCLHPYCFNNLMSRFSTYRKTIFYRPQNVYYVV